MDWSTHRYNLAVMVYLTPLLMSGCGEHNNMTPATFTQANAPQSKTVEGNVDWFQLPALTGTGELTITSSPLTESVWSTGVPDVQHCRTILGSATRIERGDYMQRGHVGGHDIFGMMFDGKGGPTLTWRIQPGGVGTFIMPNGELIFFTWDTALIQPASL